MGGPSTAGRQTTLPPAPGDASQIPPASCQAGCRCELGLPLLAIEPIHQISLVFSLTFPRVALSYLLSITFQLRFPLEKPRSFVFYNIPASFLSFPHIKALGLAKQRNQHDSPGRDLAEGWSAPGQARGKRRKPMALAYDPLRRLSRKYLAVRTRAVYRGRVLDRQAGCHQAAIRQVGAAPTAAFPPVCPSLRLDVLSRVRTADGSLVRCCVCFHPGYSMGPDGLLLVVNGNNLCFP